jgi:hypothetical protein
VTQHDGLAKSTRGEVAPGRGNGGHNISWADANLIEKKNKENSRGRLSYYKCMVEI